MKTLAPVILIHGMWATPDSLIDLRTEFEVQGYRVFTPRLPFHLPRNEMNDTTRNQLRLSGIDDYVESVSQLMASLPQRPILVGHSLGGLLAQLVAAKHPCEKLILISSAAPAGINSWTWSVAKTFGHNLFRFPLWRSIINLKLKNIRYGVANSQTPQVQNHIAQQVTLESGRVSWQVAMWFLYKNPKTWVNTRNINCPVLVLGGTQDKITPIGVQHKIAKKYGHKATLSEIKNACHWTIGGTFFPEISQTIFNWINKNSAIVCGKNGINTKPINLH